MIIDQTKHFILHEDDHSISDLNELKSSVKIWRESDIYELQLRELYKIKHPSQIFASDFNTNVETFVKEKQRATHDRFRGCWVYYPWSGELVHMVIKEEYELLRTNRNKLVITQDEQDILRTFSVCSIGLSVGGNMAVSFAYSGISNTMTLVESDVLDTTNLNRIRAKVTDVGEKKIDLISRQIYEINPYAVLNRFENGVDDTSIDAIFACQPQVIFEEIDDFPMKVKVRLAAKKHQVPLIMLTCLGENMLIDVERYDVEPDLALFNGLIGTTPEEILKAPITEADKVKYAMKIVQVENLNTRILQSLFEINKTLSGRPQLNATVTIASGIAAFIAKKIALGEPLKSGRYRIDFNSLVSITDDNDAQRDVLLKLLEERFSL